VQLLQCDHGEEEDEDDDDEETLGMSKSASRLTTVFDS
jgi:hypothetical protein